jgi:hypothetical protein
MIEEVSSNIIVKEVVVYKYFPSKKEAQKRYIEKNQEKVKEIKRNYYLKNRERILEKQKEYNKNKRKAEKGEEN